MAIPSLGTAGMRIELTDEQRRVLAEQAGRPLEVVDPHTQRTYLLVAREEYERLRSLLPDAKEPRGAAPAESKVVLPGIRRSQGALRRALPELLAQRKLRGKWICYAGDERIGIASTKAALVRACLERGLDDDAFYVGMIEPDELIEEEELDAPLFPPGG
jgi:hypothetical protein